MSQVISGDGRPSRRTWRGPGVIVSKENDSVFYYDATTEEAFHNSAISVLKSRRDYGCYTFYPENNPEPEIPREQGEALPKGSSLRIAWEEQTMRYLRGKKREQMSAAFIAKVEAAIGELDGESAWSLLLSRDDYEYEGIEYVRFSK